MASKKQITLQIPALMAVLKKAKEVMVANPPLEILENVLFNINGNKVQIVGTDTMVTIIGNLEGINISELPGTSDHEKGFSFLLPFEFLQKHCALITTDSLTIEVVQLKKQINAVLTAYHDTTKIESLANVGEFPKVPEFPNTNSIGISGEFIDWLNVATHTVAIGGKSEAMEKIYLGIDTNTIKVASCNTAVLMEKTFATESSSHKVDMLISTKIAKALAGFEQTTISWSDSHIAFVSSDITLIGRLQDQKYPNYRSIFPVESSANLTLLHSDLTTAMKKVGLTKFETRIYLKKQKGMMVLESDDTEYSRMITVQIPCEYSGDVDTVCLLPAQMLKLLGQVKYVSLALSVTSPTRAVVVTSPSDDSYRALIMPTK